MNVTFSASGPKDDARVSLSSQIQGAKQSADPIGRETIDQIGATLIHYLDSLGPTDPVTVMVSLSVNH